MSTDLGAMDSPASFYLADVGSIPTGRAICADDWTDGNKTPTEDGEYLCWVEVPRQVHGGRVRPQHMRYMALEFADGGFWINGGMPRGMVKAWIRLVPPNVSYTIDLPDNVGG